MRGEFQSRTGRLPHVISDSKGKRSWVPGTGSAPQTRSRSALPRTGTSPRSRLRPMTARTAMSTSRFLRTVLANRPSRPVGQPIFDRLPNGHRLRLADARLDVGVQTPELVPHLGPDLAAHLAADSLTVRAVPERDDSVSCRCTASARPGHGGAPCARSRWSPRSGPPRAAMARSGPARKPNGSRLVSPVSLVLSNCGCDLWAVQDLNL